MEFVKNNIIKVVCGFLCISALVNVLLYNRGNDYEKLYGEKSYGEIEGIFQKNDDINEILSQAIKTNEISKMDLIKLKSSYEQLYSSMWVVKDDYTNYKRLNKSNHLEKEDILTRDVLTKIKSYLTKFTESNINAKGDIIKLKGDNLTNFVTMNQYSTEVNDFFVRYIKNNTKDNKLDSLKAKIQKDGMWVAILDNLCRISDKYFVNDFAFREDTSATKLADSK